MTGEAADFAAVVHVVHAEASVLTANHASRTIRRERDGHHPRRSLDHHSETISMLEVPQARRAVNAPGQAQPAVW